MNAPLDILAALASYSVKAVIENGRVRLVCPKDNPPPAELIEAARAHKGELHQLLAQEARCDRFEERAAILEFDEGLSRAEAEAIARREMMAGVYDKMQAARETVSYRRYNKPALGPLGDSLDDFAPGSEAIAADNSEVTTRVDVSAFTATLRPIFRHTL